MNTTSIQRQKAAHTEMSGGHEPHSGLILKNIWHDWQHNLDQIK